MSMTTPPGWYDDGHGQQRWWDGTAWTDHVQAPQASEQPASAAYPTQPTAAWGQQPVYGAQPATNGLAIASLILSLVGFGVVGVVLGHIGLHQIKTRPPQGGRGLAIAGLVIGYISIGFVILFFAVILPALIAVGYSLQDGAARAIVTDARSSVEQFYVANGVYPDYLEVEPAAAQADITVGYGTSADGFEYCVEASSPDGGSYFATQDDATAAGDCSGTGIVAIAQN